MAGSDPMSNSDGLNFGCDYAVFLAQECETRPKGERTRASIQIAACNLLRQQAPQDMTIPQLCKAAGIAHGTFYIYFPDRNVLLADTLLGFITYLQSVMRDASSRHPDDTIRASTTAYADMFEVNAGLMKCLLHHHDAFPEAKASFHKLNSEWIGRIVASVQNKLKQTSQSEDIDKAELLRRAHALGGMVDQYLSGLILSEDPELIALSTERRDVINTLCLIWERGMEP